MVAVNQQVNTILGAYNAMVPSEGPKIIPINAQLGVNASVLLDFSQLQQQGKISFIQGVMVDNSANAQPLTIVSQTMNQKTVIPANAQAILPVFVTNPPIFIVSSAGGVNVPLFFFNIPLPAQVWGGNSAFTFVGNSLQVTDPLLEALISNLNGVNGMNVNVVSGGFAGPNNPSNLLMLSTIGATGSNLSTAAAAGQHLYLSGWEITASGDSTLLAAGEISMILTWNGGGANIAQVIAFFPTAVPTAAPSVQWISAEQLVNPIKSPGLADQVKITFAGVGLNAGHILVNIFGFSAP